MPGGSITRDRMDLPEALDRVDAEGWDGVTGRALLNELRHRVVLPVVAQIGLNDLAADQAAATGWAVGWEVLRRSSTRAASSPWGVVWTAVRRAILNERIAAAYAAKPRESWRQSAGSGERRPLSIEALAERGWEPAVEDRDPGEAVIPLVVNLMVEVGWDRLVAEDVMDAVASSAPWTFDTGWRRISSEVDAEPWQVRRLIAVLRHALLEALLRDRDSWIAREGVLALLRCTQVRRSPARMTDLGLADCLAS